MPRLPDFILDSSIYLYNSIDDANEGSDEGGSGFLIAVPYAERESETVLHSHVYAVTNSHVIEEGYPVIRLNRYDSSNNLRHDALPFTKSDWKYDFPGPDVAVCLLDDRQIVNNYKAVFLIDDALVSPDDIEKLGIGIGSEVFLVGRFVSQAGVQQNLPVVRFGNIARMNLEPIPHPNQSKRDDWPDDPQEVFLIEGRSTSGMSGSPVFCYEMTANYQVRLDSGKTRLLGIDMGHLAIEAKTEPKFHGIQDNPYAIWDNAGIMMVVPAWHIWNLLQKEELRAEREKIEKERRLEESESN